MIHFQPTHVSRGVMRAYGIEHPIGNPFGGAAYGELNGGGSILGGLGGIGSIIGGIAVIASGGTLAPLMGGLMIAGGAMSTIGAISGNSNLVKIGGITSAVGGIGSMGMSIYDNWGSITETVGGWLSSGTEIADDAATLAGSASDAVKGGMDLSQWADDANYLEALNGADDVAGSIVNTPTSASFQGGGYNPEQFANAMADQINQTSPLVSESIAANVNPNNMYASAQGMTDAGGMGSSALKTLGESGFTFDDYPSQAMIQSGTANPAATSQMFNAGGADLSAYYNDPNYIEALTGKMPGQAPNSGGLLQSVGNFIEKNPMASMMGMQAISGMAQGASPKSQAEGEYLQAMADLKNAEASYLQAAQDAKVNETIANTEYLQSKAAEFDKTKAYAEEKRKAYNDSIKNLQMPSNYIDYNNVLFNPTTATNNAGIINGARA